MENENLTESEKALFQRLSKATIPPASLEEKIVQTLKNEGQIKNAMQMNNLGKWAVGIAATITLFIAGIFFEKVTSTSTDIQPKMGYMLILHEDESFQPGDPMEMFEEYSNWMGEAIEKGTKITGQELRNEAVLVTKEGENPRSNEQRTTGYFVFEANSLEEAIQIAQNNPHVKYGGTIEVKQFMVR